MGNNKYERLIQWIKTNIKKEDLDPFQTTADKCNYVMNLIKNLTCDKPNTYKRLYELLYRIGYAPKLDEKKTRIEWMNQNRDEILNILANDSKTTNNQRIIYAMNKINQDLNANYTQKEIRGYLTNAGLMSKYFKNVNINETS